MRLLPRPRPSAAQDAVSALLAPEEDALRRVDLTDGGCLVLTRLALYAGRAEGADRWGWAGLSRVTWAAGLLTVVPTVPAGEWAGGVDVVRDGPAQVFRPVRPDRLTDLVHTRVRRSVAASARVEHPGGGGWATLRRVPGTDGLMRQFRLDPAVGTAPAGLADAAAPVFDGLTVAAARAAAAPARSGRPGRPGRR